MSIKPPIKPTEPQYEPEDLPDQEHQWEKNEDGEVNIMAYCYDPHNGPECELCGYFDCHHCNPGMYEDKSCLREQAEERNSELRAQYLAELKKYEAQIEYYNQIKEAA